MARAFAEYPLATDRWLTGRRRWQCLAGEIPEDEVVPRWQPYAWRDQRRRGFAGAHQSPAWPPPNGQLTRVASARGALGTTHGRAK